jgi:hypothetical protein
MGTEAMLAEAAESLSVVPVSVGYRVGYEAWIAQGGMLRELSAAILRHWPRPTSLHILAVPLLVTFCIVRAQPVFPHNLSS